MGQTSPDGLMWPEYADEAAVPQDMQELAQATQTALTARRGLLVPFTGMSRTTDVALTADIRHNITFEAAYAQPANTTPAMTHTINQWSRFVVTHPGLHTLELDVTVEHPSASAENTFEVGVWTGAQGPSAVETINHLGRISMHLTQNWQDSFYVYVQPVGTGATGWKLTYARIALTGA